MVVSAATCALRGINNSSVPAPRGRLWLMTVKLALIHQVAVLRSFDAIQALLTVSH